jgi:hypothetical protein
MSSRASRPSELGSPAAGTYIRAWLTWRGHRDPWLPRGAGAVIGLTVDARHQPGDHGRGARAAAAAGIGLAERSSHLPAVVLEDTAYAVRHGVPPLADIRHAAGGALCRGERGSRAGRGPGVVVAAPSPRGARGPGRDGRAGPARAFPAASAGQAPGAEEDGMGGRTGLRQRPPRSRFRRVRRGHRSCQARPTRKP